MNLIIELVSPIHHREVYYEKYRVLDSDNGKRLLEKRVSISSAHVKDEDGFEYMFLYNTKFEVISPVFNYLNIHYTKKKNSRYLALTALKFLYSFVELFNIELTKMTQHDVDCLIEFLQGIPRIGRTISLEFKTKRDNDTVNTYLSVYRGFFQFLGINNPGLMNARVIEKFRSSEGMMAHAKKELRTKYNSSLPSNKARMQKKVPKYIKEEQYIRLIEIIKTSPKYGLREFAIVRLMYENGMRLGETLGLTLEDLPNPSNINENDKSAPIVIRNRVTDRYYQRAKGLFEPSTRYDYNTDTYTTEEVGWEKVPTTTSLLSTIYEYIDDALEKVEMSVIKSRNYLSSKADKVTNKELPAGDNHYIFLNKNGEPLSSSGWNDVLRKLFQEVGLGLDKEKRVHNLSHRFRHGFAMAYIHYLKLAQEERKNTKGILELKKLMRHRNISSTMIYYNPDDKEISQMHTEHKLYLIERYPDLFTNLFE